MRSSSNRYFSRLDHVRGLAALLVYCWHFVHISVPFTHVPGFFALSIFEEGHLGVALFMTLSGYLFAKITDGKPIDFGRFYWNRALRLAPLAFLMLAFWVARGIWVGIPVAESLGWASRSGGMWSIVVELHFYIVFPVILLLQARTRILPLIAILILSNALRTYLWLSEGEVQMAAYWSIVGCIDLFVGGMLWHELSARGFGDRHANLLLAIAVLATLGLAHGFNSAGGFFNLGGTYPSPSSAWIWLPAANGLLFGAVIVFYEKATFRLPRLLDTAFAKVGEVSYSVYLLHFAFYKILAKSLAAAGLPMQHFGVSFAFALMTFPLIVGLAWLTYVWIERPFLALRKRYDTPVNATEDMPKPEPITTAAPLAASA